MIDNQPVTRLRFFLHFAAAPTYVFCLHTSSVLKRYNDCNAVENTSCSGLFDIVQSILYGIGIA